MLRSNKCQTRKKIEWPDSIIVWVTSTHTQRTRCVTTAFAKGRHSILLPKGRIVADDDDRNHTNTRLLPTTATKSSNRKKRKNGMTENHKHTHTPCVVSWWLRNHTATTNDYTTDFWQIRVKDDARSDRPIGQTHTHTHARAKSSEQSKKVREKAKITLQSRC